MNSKYAYEWAVIGAGPAGIATIAELLEVGVNPKSIIWIDPEFTVGDFGKHWGYVTSNTTVKKFKLFLNGFKYFESCLGGDKIVEIDQLDEDGFCELHQVSKPLQVITDHLRTHVGSIKDIVKSLDKVSEAWLLQAKTNEYRAKKIVIAIGCVPKSLSSEYNPNEITTNDALNPKKLASLCNASDTVAVYGSSHSAMIVIKELINIGVKKVINYYKSPIKYAVKMDGWILYDNTGLKAKTAQWVRENISRSCLPNIERIQISSEHHSEKLNACTKIIYAVGFEPRTIKVNNINMQEYDQSTGIIAPGLFGVGIAFPQITISPYGHKELNVGLWKFMNDIKKIMPLWMKYEL